MIEVLRGGLCDLVIDQGRPGLGALGVPVGGAADPAALAAANRLVGNEMAAGGLEITLAGPALRFRAGGVVALAGARFAATRRKGAAVAWNETMIFGAGEILALGMAEAGCRCWLAIRGGLAVPQVMGSRSTYLPGGFGGYQGRPLQTGDLLEAVSRMGDVHLLRAHPPLGCTPDALLRVVAGPQAGLFDDAGLAAFFGGTYQVGPASDRRGLRLSGPRVLYAQTELPSQGVLPGAIQIPPDGQPIILGWDGPVTGGYPVIAGVISVDWPRLAQLRPGEAVRFATIEAEAGRLLAEGSSWKFEDAA